MQHNNLEWSYMGNEEVEGVVGDTQTQTKRALLIRGVHVESRADATGTETRQGACDNNLPRRLAGVNDLRRMEEERVEVRVEDSLKTKVVRG